MAKSLSSVEGQLNCRALGLGTIDLDSISHSTLLAHSK